MLVMNKNPSDLKQIAWEEKRNRWLQGFNKAVGSRKGDNFKSRGGKSKQFKKKKVSSNEAASHIKKRKRF